MTRHVNSFTRNGVQSHVYQGSLTRYTILGPLPKGAVQHHEDHKEQTL